jgi:hypothetical protein
MLLCTAVKSEEMGPFRRRLFEIEKMILSEAVRGT